MKSKIIHKVCGKTVNKSGSANQPQYSCKACGLLPDGEIITKYECIECKKLFGVEDGEFNYNENGDYFICKDCRVRRLQNE